MKVIIFAVCFCLFALGLAQTIQAQDQIAHSSASAPGGGGSRQQDSLNGQVRRVRVETVNLLVKEGKTVEGPRVVRAITTYDQKGEKIDFVAYSAEDSKVAGNRQYLNDAKGNIIEMVLRGDDGSILNKEKYDYQFDEFGNWKKMTASIAVLENGKVGYEPFEITYRTITYYYGQPAPKVITAPTVPPISNTSTTATASGPAKITKPTTDAPVSVAATGIAISDVKTSNHAEAIPVKPEKSEASITAPVSVAATGIATSDVKKTSNAAEATAVKTEKSEPSITTPTAVTPKDDAPKLPVIRISEEALRKAVIHLPQPQYPEAAMLKTSESNQGISDLKILQPGDSSEANPKPATDSPAPAASPYAKGLAFLASGHNSEAAEALRQALERDPNDAAAYAKLGIAYAALQRHQEAVDALKMAIRIKPAIVDSEAYYQLSNGYTALRKFSNALEAIKQAMYIKRAEQANPEVANTPRSLSLADLHYSTGLAYYNLRRFSGAIEELKQVIALNPKLAQAYYGLALSYIANGDRKSAEKQQDTLESLDPVYAAKIAKLLSPSFNDQQGFGFVFKTNP